MQAYRWVKLTARGLNNIWVLSLWNATPDRRNHEIFCAVGIGNDAMVAVSPRLLYNMTFPEDLEMRNERESQPKVIIYGKIAGMSKVKYLFAAWETGMRSLSRSSRRREFSSVRRRSLRSAIDCLFFFIWPGSSREEYPEGMVKVLLVDVYRNS
jgi:hypothetical protein